MSLPKRQAACHPEVLDHIVPLSRGGEHSHANVQVAHRTCNQRKYNKHPADMAA